MKTPTNCPFCNSMMHTDFFGRISTSKICDTINHFIQFIVKNDTNEIMSIKIRLNDQINVIRHIYWIFSTKEVYIMSSKAHDINLPWFEPDLSNYQKLNDKIKLYTILM